MEMKGKFPGRRALPGVVALLAACLFPLDGMYAKTGASTTQTYEILFDTGGQVLGAYTIDLEYNRERTTLQSVAGGASPLFATAPFCNAKSFTSGSTRLSAYQARSMTEPVGMVSVARVTVTTKQEYKGEVHKGKPAPIHVKVLVAADARGAAPIQR